MTATSIPCLLRRPLAIAMAAVLLTSLTACSGTSDDSSEQVHDRSAVPSLVGEHFYSCEDGAKLDADFLTDGLTLDLTRLPGGKPERFTSPATGLTFVGNKLNVTITGGDLMILTGSDGEKLTCRRSVATSYSNPRNPGARHYFGRIGHG